MTKSFKIVGFTLLAFASIAAAGVAGVTIKRTPKQGEINKYKMTAEVDFQGTPITFSGSIQEKVTQVATDGSFTVEQSQLEAKVTMGGSEMDVPSNGGPTTTVFLPTGLVKEIKGDGASAEAYRMINLGAFVEAGKELNVGDTWTHEFKADAKTGAVAGKAEYKYLGEEKVGEVETYKVKVNVAETEGDAKASSDSTVWLDKATGVLVKMEGKWVNAPFPNAPMPINATVVLVREP